MTGPDNLLFNDSAKGCRYGQKLRSLVERNCYSVNWQTAWN